ncbi:MAG: hypothetical protein COB04_04260 [Gammaproteobacteria bacterium]|nr:MAG: hypothetical protein COB04_04260 [Gammaproteobacteria bacterium]
MKFSLAILDPVVSPIKEALSPVLNSAESWFYKLEARDRNALLVLSVFLGIAILYFGVWFPAKNGLAEAEEDYRKQAELVTWMVANETQAKAVGSSLSGSSSKKLSGSLYKVVNQVARKKSMSLKRYEPDGNDKLRVWLENVSFNQFVSWMQELVQRGIIVSNVSVESQDAVGKINAKIIFKRG